MNSTKTAASGTVAVAYGEGALLLRTVLIELPSAALPPAGLALPGTSSTLLHVRLEPSLCTTAACSADASIKHALTQASAGTSAWFRLLLPTHAPVWARVAASAVPGTALCMLGTCTDTACGTGACTVHNSTVGGCDAAQVT